MIHPRWSAVLALAVVLSGPAFSASAQTKSSLTVALAAESTTMDPAKYSAGVDQYYIGTMFEQLVRPGPEGERMNWLAESWEVLEVDGKPVIDVKIRPDVTFHNGDPLTAADFEFAYQRLRDPAVSRWPHYQANVAQFEIVDDLHFKLHFTQGDANYIANWLQLWAIPKAYFEAVGEDEFAQRPIGTGPWKFVSRSVKEELVLDRYEGYWNQEHHPTVDRLIVKIIPEDLTRVAAFRTGDVDWIDSVPPAMIKEVEALDNVATASRVSGNNLFFDMDMTPEDSPFRKLEVRQAVAYGADIDAIIEQVLFGQGQRYVEVGPDETAYDPELKPYPYDPAKAMQLLADAGYPNGFETNCYNLITPREPNIKEMGEAFFAYLSAIGIRCNMKNLEYGAWINVNRRAEDTPQMEGGILSHMWGHGVPGDPGTAWSGHLHSFVPGEGWGSYSHTAGHPEMDEMVEAVNTIMDPDEREAALQEIARKKHELVLGGLTTYRPLVTFAWRADKVAYTPWPHPGFWRNFQEIGLKQD